MFDISNGYISTHEKKIKGTLLSQTLNVKENKVPGFFFNFCSGAEIHCQGPHATDVMILIIIITGVP